MNTYEIDRKELESLPLVAEGYKVMYYDGGTRQFFKYTKEIGEPLAGRIFRTDGEIWSCPYCRRNGHVSDNPPFCKWCGKALDWRGIK